MTVQQVRRCAALPVWETVPSQRHLGAGKVVCRRYVPPHSGGPPTPLTSCSVPLCVN